MVHHQHPAEPVGQVGQSLGLADGRGQRLLDQHVLAGLQAPHGEREVGRDRRGDGDRVERQLEQLVHRRDGRQSGVCPA